MRLRLHQVSRYRHHYEPEGVRNLGMEGARNLERWGQNDRIRCIRIRDDDCGGMSIETSRIIVQYSDPEIGVDR